MVNLYFPQLLSGALAQYPVSKSKRIRTVTNVYADGSLSAWPDSEASMLEWKLSYRGLSTVDVGALQGFFDACVGPYRAFTFIDPTDNMLVSSADLTSNAWQRGLSVVITTNVADPKGGTGGFGITNSSQAPAGVTQALQVPSNYQYCFSVYVRSPQPGQVTLSRISATSRSDTAFPVGMGWSRLVSSGRLNDGGTTLSVSVNLSPGQGIDIFGPQLEAQPEPSRYSATFTRGGVYPTAHWAASSLDFVAEAPNSFATNFSIQSAI